MRYPEKGVPIPRFASGDEAEELMRIAMVEAGLYPGSLPETEVEGEIRLEAEMRANKTFPGSYQEAAQVPDPIKTGERRNQGAWTPAGEGGRIRVTVGPEMEL